MRVPDYVLRERYQALTGEPINLRWATWTCLAKSMISDEDVAEILRIKVRWRVLLGRYMRQPISEIDRLTAREIRQYIEVLHDVVSQEHGPSRDQ